MGKFVAGSGSGLCLFNGRLEDFLHWGYRISGINGITHNLTTID